MDATLTPEPRVVHSYNGITTILEGAELTELTRLFHELMKSKVAKLNTDADGKVLIAALQAYQHLYRRPVCSEEDLERLDTADARKADLFYKYMCVSVKNERARNN
ncbi:MAG: hypothetical protein WCI20_02025 [bacterium]